MPRPLLQKRSRTILSSYIPALSKGLPSYFDRPLGPYLPAKGSPFPVIFYRLRRTSLLALVRYMPVRIPAVVQVSRCTAGTVDLQTG
jgi:hypothetical protein